MDTFASHSMDDPHEVRPFAANGQVQLVDLDGFTLGRGTFEPGWKWSNDVKPIAGTDSCQAPHAGYVMSGAMTIRMDDGNEYQVSAGDAVRIEPGHDAWVDADASEPCIMLETATGAVNTYAKPAD